jgi:hypothetical protein
MNKMILKLKCILSQDQNRIFLIVFLITVGLACIPLFSSKLFVGHDTNYHLLRIESLREGMLSLKFPVRINPFFFNDYGYASSIFYPDFFLYFPAVLRIIGFSIEISYKIFLVLTITVCFLSTYFCSKAIFKNKFSATIVAIVFSLSQYHLQNIYTRAALGEIQSFMFIPFIACGLYNLIFEKYDKPWLLIIGFIGLCFSHVISLFIAGILAVVISLFNFKKVFFDPEKIKKLFISILIILGCTSLFWAPFIEQVMSDNFVFQLMGHSAPGGMGVRLPVLFANAYLIDGRTCSFGLALLLLCALRILVRKTPETKDQIKIINWSLLIGFSILFVSSELFPWKYMPSIFGSIQFAWRFYSFASMFLAIAIGGIIQILSGTKYPKLGLFLLLIFMGSSAINVIMHSVEYSTDITTEYMTNNQYQIGNGEWLPIEVDRDEIRTKKPALISDDGSSLNFSKNGIATTFTSKQVCKYYDVPLIYYKGYAAVFKDSSGNSEKLMISNEGPSKTVRVYCHGFMGNGTITVDYSGTPIQKTSLILSLLLFILTLIIYRRKRHPENHRSDENC